MWVIAHCLSFIRLLHTGEKQSIQSPPFDSDTQSEKLGYLSLRLNFF